MYTIKEAASRSGVSVQLLRAWERRYGVVSPNRTPSGYRLYGEGDIERLRAMRHLVDDGWAPSNAAARLDELSEEDIAELSQRAVAPMRSEAASRLPADDLAEAFVASAADLDEPAFEAVLDEMFARGSFEQVTGQLVLPALVALGEGWATGRLDVAAEHAASSAVQRRLGMAYMAAAAPRDTRDLVLVGLPPGARHDLGALAFATALRRAGIGVRYLGADLPLEDWVEAVERTQPRAAVIGVIMKSDVAPAVEVAQAARRANSSVLIAFGGRSAEAVDVERLQPVIVLPDEMGAAIQALRAALPAASSRADTRR